MSVLHDIKSLQLSHCIQVYCSKIFCISSESHKIFHICARLFKKFTFYVQVKMLRVVWTWKSIIMFIFAYKLGFDQWSTVAFACAYRWSILCLCVRIRRTMWQVNFTHCSLCGRQWIQCQWSCATDTTLHPKHTDFSISLKIREYLTVSSSVSSTVSKISACDGMQYPQHLCRCEVNPPEFNYIIGHF